MPIYNGGKYLSQALESVRGQTYKNLEILLINDGSTDNSDEVIERFAQSEKRVVVISKENTGLVDTLNTGLRAANGCWIARLDQDDIAHITRIERQVAAVSRARGTILVGSDFSTLIDETGKTKRYRLPSNHNQLVKRLRRMQSFFPHSSVMFNADAGRSIGGYETLASYNEDWDLWLRLSERGQIASVPESLVTVRKHQEQMTQNSGGVIPQGEAFVSSTLHFLRTGYSVNVEGLDFRDLQVRNQIQNTERYKKFHEIVKFQDNIRHSLADEKTYFEKGLWGFSLLTKPQKLFELFRFWMFGTTAPMAVAAEVAMALHFSRIEVTKETHLQKYQSSVK